MTDQISFDDGAAYERYMGKWSQLAGEIFLDWLAPKPGLRWLDVGCGNGAFTEMLVERCAPVSVQGIDPSEKQLAYARRRHATRVAQFRQGDAMALPFPDDTFDALTSFGLLEHFADVDRVIAEMVRVIRPGGMFFADIVPERFSVQTLGTVFNAGVRVAYYGAQGRPGRGLAEARRLFRPDFYENDYSLETYRRYLREAGLRGVVVRGNRPVPVLTLPGVIERPYVAALRRARGLWRRFDEAGTPLTAWWGAGWWAWGVKLPRKPA